MTSRKKTAKHVRVPKSPRFGRAVLASLRGWERGEPLTVRKVPQVNALAPARTRNASAPRPSA
jgi:hypothetical protein